VYDSFTLRAIAGAPSLMAAKDFIEASLEDSEVETAISMDSKGLVIDRHIGLL
jgi:hypothetical protein